MAQALCNVTSPNNTKSAPDFARVEFAAHKRHLWGVAYRMLGVGADADDVVQDCFMRLLGTTIDRTRPVRPWLVRVTVNLARDQLRARQRMAYDGPWLPGLVEDNEDNNEDQAPPATVDPEARYSQLESLSLGFLLAAEKLTELQRATMVLRDVYGYSVRESSQALEISEANVKTTLHRARATMAAWEHKQRRSLDIPAQRVIDVMMRFFAAVKAGDRSAAEALLAADVVLLSDGAGEFYAARKPVLGADRVARWCLGVSKRGTDFGVVRLRNLNGQPGLWTERTPRAPREGPRAYTQVTLNDQGHIAEILVTQATRKLLGL